MLSAKSEVRALMLYTKEQVKKAHSELDKVMSGIPNACVTGCDACCYQMVAVHTWEEELIGSYIRTTMHAGTKKIVRKQMMEWWRYLVSVLRRPTKDNPISQAEYLDLQQMMITERVKCPFLVDSKCSIYSVRPAVCRSYVVPDNPKRCSDEPGRMGDMRPLPHFIELFGAESKLLPVERYYHAMKPLAFAMTEELNVPAPSTPVESVAFGDLIPSRWR